MHPNDDYGYFNTGFDLAMEELATFNLLEQQAAEIL
jgi:hypothetical protein